MAMCNRHCFPSQASHSRLSFRNLWQERSRTFMSSSTSTAWKKDRPVRHLLSLVLGVVGLAVALQAQDVTLRGPSDAVAGSAAKIATTGSGSATFYLVCPPLLDKKNVTPRRDI